MLAVFFYHRHFRNLWTHLSRFTRWLRSQLKHGLNTSNALVLRLDHLVLSRNNFVQLLRRQRSSREKVKELKTVEEELSRIRTNA